MRPSAQHPQAAKHGKQLADRLQRMAGDMQAAALRIRGVGVGARADDQFPLSDWLMYAWMVLDMTTHGNTGFTGSDTSACSG